MNRFPLWKYLIIGLVLVFGFIYSVPNLFPESPAVQVSSTKATIKLDNAFAQRVEAAVKKGGLTPTASQFDGNSIRVRLKSTEDQAKARAVLEKDLNPDPNDPIYVVALNELPGAPSWLISMGALPMYLGLDLKGGVHFLLQVDMKQALSKRIDGTLSDIRGTLREKDIRHAGIARNGNNIDVKFRLEADAAKARAVILDSLPDLDVAQSKDGEDFKLTATFKPEAERAVQQNALKQNITTLNNRINALGVSEPVIQQQGVDRVVVQLPGVQDPAKAKEILGRTATLEVRMVCETREELDALAAGTVPLGCERYRDRDGQPILVKKAVILTGDNLNDASAGFDGQTQEPTVNLNLDSKGTRIFRDVTRENINKRMAILLIEKGKGEVVTAPVIRSEIGGGRVQISGKMTSNEAADTALLLRAGSLAAPMEIIEERTIGPSLGAENIARGRNSLLIGFAAIAVFMCLYYMLFGVFSTVALAVNLVLLVAVLSLVQATLTLPGIAAIALTLGMAIDANVLINERVREELRNGRTPQEAIREGYDRAWATILDSNITTLIAGVALLVFGSGAIRGFALVHCIGILTSMFSAVLFSRALVNLWYGSKKKLQSVSIGTVWKA
jgi:preprotein translocase subunit SecD